MKHLFIFIYCTCMFIHLHAQTGFDNSFSEDGYDQKDFTIKNEMVTKMVAYPDGKTLVTGFAIIEDIGYSFLLRYNENGTPDVSFGEEGMVLFNLDAEYLQTNEIKIDDAGFIYVGGLSKNGLVYKGFIARFTSEGVLDISYANEGIYYLSLTGFYNDNAALIILEDHSLLGAFYGYDMATYSSGIVKLDIEGQPDPAFGIDGVAMLDYPLFKLNTIDIQTNGNIVGGGTIEEIINHQVAIVRLTATGLPDLTFSDDGWLTLDYSTDEDECASIISLEDNAILVGSNSKLPDNVGVLTMLTESGAIQNDFGVDGKTIIDSFIIAGMERDASGNIFTIDGSSVWEQNDIKIAKITASGAPDITFGLNGIGITPFYEPVVSNCLALQADGKILTGGYSGTFATQCFTSRLLDDNKLDIFQAQHSDDIPLFPNPVTAGNYVYFYTPAQTGFTNCCLIDANGKVVFNQQIENGTNAIMNKVFLPEQITHGIYMFKLFNKSSSCQTSVVVL